MEKLYLRNDASCVYTIGDKDIIPGLDPVEVTEEEANHPMIAQYIEDKKLFLIREVVEDAVPDKSKK